MNTMKFKKILTIGIGPTSLEANYWSQIDSLADKRVSVSKDSSEINQELIDTDCLLTSFGVPVTKEMIDLAPNLQYIGVAATAFGKIDITAAREKGIAVSNLAGYSTEAVAEFTIAIILEAIRQLEIGKQRGRGGNYSEAGIKAREIKNSIFAVIGLGSIGQRVAEIAHGFGADVRYWSRQKKDVSFTYQDVDTLLAQADFISLNLAQTPETEKFVNKERLQNLKPGAVLVSTVPMELMDIEALTERLAVGDITFVLDHSDETSPEVMAKLAQFPNCIVYPPMAYITDEAKAAKQKIFVANLENFLSGAPTNIVN